MGSACQNGASAKADAFILSKTLLKINILHISTRIFFNSRTRARRKDAHARACLLYLMSGLQFHFITKSTL